MNAPEAIMELVGSVQILSSAARHLLEEKLLRETAGGRLTFSQLKLLKLGALTDIHTISDAAAFLDVSNAAASKAVEKLVRRGLLRRTEGETDRRASELSITGQGRHLLNKYEAARNQKLANIFGAYMPEQLYQTAVTLDRFSASILEEGAKPEELCLQCGIYFREKCPLREFVQCTCFYQKPKGRKAAVVSRVQPPPR